MIENHLILAIGLLLVVLILIMVSNKLGISSAIFLVIAGSLISLIPGVPALRLEPELLFIVILPPLLYRAAWNTCWKDFWANRRPISLHGFGLVVVTAGGIGLLTHFLIPNFSLALGFLLGSIVAPPDALAATSVLQQLKIPKRIVTILEGESLVNDAASLILYRFAVAAVVSGQFSLGEASTEFIFASLSGIGIGCGIAAILYLVHRFLPTNASIDTVVSVASPYLMYLTAEKLEASGVLAVVSGGFFLSYHSSKTLTSQARLQMLGVWETLVFVLNGVVFIVVGLQLPLIVEKLGDISLPKAILLGFAISVVVMLIRMLWIFPATYLPRFFDKKLRKNDPYPGWQSVFLMGWCGMRGIVTLASALTIPLLLADGTTFPFRSLILFEAFTVIIFTLVFQGLSLPYLIRRLGIMVPAKEEIENSELVTHLAGIALGRIMDNYGEEALGCAPFVRQREKYERLAKVRVRDSVNDPDKPGSPLTLEKYHQMKREIIAVRREELSKLRSRNIYSDELIRRKEFELDLEQISIGFS
ncbi:Na+/H+ antiporter [Dyadobacter sp. NIV53]|uniref:Na+/H+ antiporter n=1 Tax=Dyadobacter sp. NIV53 TaxID=2861765 RepID=UPI001C8817CD|nr:Na+/H+ antiporter [Dyadobacter sp. NIV53]